MPHKRRHRPPRSVRGVRRSPPPAWRVCAAGAPGEIKRGVAGGRAAAPLLATAPDGPTDPPSRDIQAWGHAAGRLLGHVWRRTGRSGRAGPRRRLGRASLVAAVAREDLQTLVRRVVTRWSVWGTESERPRRGAGVGQGD